METKISAAAAGGRDWQDTLNSVLAQLPNGEGVDGPDLALVFASPGYSSAYEEILKEIDRRLRPRLLLGCSGVGVIGSGQEIEGQPAIALQTLSLPGARIEAHHLLQEDLEKEDAWPFSDDREDARACLVFADPFTLDGEALLRRLSEMHPALPVVGGLASGHPNGHSTYLFRNQEILEEGALVVQLAGDYQVKTVVSQGCAPIGDTWTITAVHDNIIESIGMRPALEVLYETLNGLPPEVLERARRNLLVGLAMDEYRDEFGRGDFLVRNLLGIDQHSGSIAVGAWPRVGQTLQFQMRDPEAADEDLEVLLRQTSTELAEHVPLGALLCCCTGRGVGLFGEPSHDVQKLEKVIGPLPVAGFFCNGEFGPVGGQNFLHGFTASLALILPAAS